MCGVRSAHERNILLNQVQIIVAFSVEFHLLINDHAVRLEKARDTDGDEEHVCSSDRQKDLL